MEMITFQDWASRKLLEAPSLWQEKQGQKLPSSVFPKSSVQFNNNEIIA